MIPGGVAELIDLSSSGALVETRGKLAAGVPVTLCIGGANPQRLAGRTVRCQVCAIRRDSTMTYQIAIAFDQPTVIETMRDAATPSAIKAVPPPAREAAVADLPESPNEW